MRGLRGEARASVFEEEEAITGGCDLGDGRA